MESIRRPVVLLASLGAVLSLVGAYGFEHVGGYAPCELCLLQRWPHWIAIGLGAAWLIRPMRVWLWGGLLSMVTGAVLGVYHAGVQQHWWPGPSACSGPRDIGALSPEDLMAQIMAARWCVATRCRRRFSASDAGVECGGLRRPCRAVGGGAVPSRPAVALAGPAGRGGGAALAQRAILIAPWHEACSLHRGPTPPST
ncbi:MAG: disulfide bond formation protein B [Rhodobacteraceae bacterium]|nr:disulfide bond formation protein B [Paracoccaceae bacterium]